MEKFFENKWYLALKYALCLICFSVVLNLTFHELSTQSTLRSRLVSVYTNDAFRELEIGPIYYQACQNVSAEHRIPIADLICSEMLEQGFDLSDKAIRPENLESKILTNYYRSHFLKRQQLEDLIKCYEAIFTDLKLFPVAQVPDCPDATINFENSWLGKRTYGGDRHHEGTDLMAAVNERNLYPIVSMTDGVVEQIGWLNQGGYRIGIRSPHGGYFYYAHLSSYAKEWQIGENVTAGTILGMMGDTGYSEIEGTTGNFPVHLHFGLYIKTPTAEEYSVNPYWILKIMENNKKHE